MHFLSSNHWHPEFPRKFPSKPNGLYETKINLVALCLGFRGSSSPLTLNNVDESWVTPHFIWSNTAQGSCKDQQKSMKNKQETSMSVMRTWNATNPWRNPKIAFNGRNDDEQGKRKQERDEMKWCGSGNDHLERSLGDFRMSLKYKLGILNWTLVKKSHFEI